MYLKRLELQGFKTFAQRTILEFELDSNGRRGLTSIVGPNGSGKSNIADAIRWVMGEQSLKLLRSKKSEDVIFSGSEKKPRSGFAEVTMTLVNDDQSELEMSEIVITRRLYRDGQSEYEINKQACKLSDINMLLAQAGVGQRTYSVIGQGMVDEILSASPIERKAFFDEAAGLKPLQLKKQSSLNKLANSKNNLQQSELLLREIAPRLHSLERQVKRLQQRESIEEQVKELEEKYYGGMWFKIKNDLESTRQKLQNIKTEVDKINNQAQLKEKELQEMEIKTPPSDSFHKLRQQVNDLMNQRSKLREKQYRLEASQEVAKVRAEKPWSPLPLSKIISNIENILNQQDKLLTFFDSSDFDHQQAQKHLQDLKEKTQELFSKLQRPAPEPNKEPQPDKKVAQELKQLIQEIEDINFQIKNIQEQINQLDEKEKKSRAHIFTVQRELSKQQSLAHQKEKKLNEIQIEIARIETRRDSFLQEALRYVPNGQDGLDELSQQKKEELDFSQASSRLIKLRAQLELIGGIDPEIITEYEQTKKRYEELNTQVQDLVEAIASLEIIIKELDQTISTKSKESFVKLNQAYAKYFKMIFNGGSARLLEVYPKEIESEDNVITVEDKQKYKKNQLPIGIDIQATPPTKKLKAISLLSGGERALVSIALICAIMATNPSPFVVLDEVDAALDESNSHKFAEIISSLADKTQFLVVTHNRASMEKAHILYGVTMGEDGISKLLSVKLNDVIKR